MFENNYIIDIIRDAEGYKFVVRDISTNVVKTFNNSNYVIQQTLRDVSNLIEASHLVLYGRVRNYRDGNFIFDLFKKVIFVILLEQNLSYLANANGYRIHYPDFSYYAATLYKFYKVFVNPNTTLNLQEFILIIGPLLTRVNINLTSKELVNLFDIFALNYYKAIDYIYKMRLGLISTSHTQTSTFTQNNTISRDNFTKKGISRNNKPRLY
ncbi:MAG: hypothetical protein ACO2ON_03780 [Candidatus Nanopusillus sp.]